jgi:hypothetical protein
MFSSCGERRYTSVDSALVRDSSGIRIIEFTLETNPASGVWRLASQPDLTLDSREDDPIFQFFRVADVLPLPNGGLAVANGGTSEIRIFDAEGGYERTIGRPGEGPGEFRGLAWIALRPPDSLVVADARLRRVTVFDAVGEPVRTATTVGPSSEGGQSAMAPPQPLGMFGDGSFLTVSYDGPTLTAGLDRPLARLLRYTPDASSNDLLGSWPGNEVHLVADGGRLGVFVTPFARVTRIAVGADRFWVADSERWELRGYSPEGRLSALVRRQGGDVPVTASLLEDAIRERYKNVPDGAARERTMERQRQIEQHATLPAFSDVQLGVDGRLWVGAFSLPGDTVLWWSAVDPDGALVARVGVPSGMEVLRFAANYVVVLMRDELDREHIRRYRLVRY